MQPCYSGFGHNGIPLQEETKTSIPKDVDMPNPGEITETGPRKKTRVSLEQKGEASFQDSIITIAQESVAQKTKDIQHGSLPMKMVVKLFLSTCPLQF